MLQKRTLLSEQLSIEYGKVVSAGDRTGLSKSVKKRTLFWWIPHDWFYWKKKRWAALSERLEQLDEGEKR